MFDLTSKERLILFGKFIRQVREENKWCQWEIAEKLGVDQSFISYLERGGRNVDLMFAMDLCKALGVKLSDFVKIVEDEEENEYIDENVEDIEEA